MQKSGQKWGSGDWLTSFCSRMVHLFYITYNIIDNFASEISNINNILKQKPMKKYFLKTFAVAAALMLSGNTWAIDQDGDGNYIIATAQDLVDFANLYNNQPNNGKIPGASAIFTADIDMAGVAFPGIGNDSHENRRFHGTLDGQGHKISNLVMEGDCVALIRVASDNAVIKNLVIDSSCEFKGTGRNAAFISASNWPEWGSNTIRFENCGNEANVTGSGANCAAFLGCNYAGSLKIEIENCYNTGHIKGGWESAVFSGWFGNGSSTVKNSWNIAEAEGVDGSNFFGRGIGEGNYINCYQLSGQATGQAASVDADLLATGEFCYMLNGSKPDGAWKQTIGTDAHPTTLSTSLPVYANGAFNCDGTSKGSVAYANTNASVTDPHQFGADDLCTVCHKAGREAELVDGFYQIGTIGKLVWFASQVNGGNVTAKAALTADIAQGEADYQPIGSTANVYKGEIDGNGHSVTLNINRPDQDYQGLCGVITDGVWIHDITVKGDIVGRNSVGGIAGGTNGGANNAAWTLLERCGNEANVTAKGNNAGGMIGVNMNGSASFIFNDCYNTGAIKGGESGALSGWSGGGWSVFNSCWNAGLAGEGGDDFTRNNGTQLRNCYSVEGTTNATQAAMVAESMLASGELAYKLGAAWRQNIGEDATPVLDATHGIVGLITAAGYATQYIASADVEIPAGVKAYTATVENETLVLNELSDAIAAQEAVIVQGAEGYYSFVPTTGAEKAQKNGLVGVEADTEAIEGTYVLQSQNEKVGFYQVGEVKPTVKAGRAYLATESEVKAFLLEDAVTAISKLASEGQKAQIFDINGRQTGKLQKGINIVNGVKVLVK